MLRHLRRGVAPSLVALVVANAVSAPPADAALAPDGFVFNEATARAIAAKAAPFLGAGLGRDMATLGPKLAAGGAVVAVTLPGWAGAVFVGVTAGAAIGALATFGKDWWDKGHQPEQPRMEVDNSGNLKLIPSATPNTDTGLWTVTIPTWPRDSTGHEVDPKPGDVSISMSLDRSFPATSCTQGGTFGYSLMSTSIVKPSGYCSAVDSTYILGGPVGTAGYMVLLGFRNVAPGSYMIRNNEWLDAYSSREYTGGMTLPPIPVNPSPPPPAPQFPDPAYGPAFAGGGGDGAIKDMMAPNFAGRGGPSSNGVNIVIDGSGIIAIGPGGRPVAKNTGQDITGNVPSGGTTTAGPGVGPKPTNPDLGTGSDPTGSPDPGGEPGGGGSPPPPSSPPSSPPSAPPSTPPSTPPSPPPDLPDWKDEFFLERFLRKAGNVFPFDYFHVQADGQAAQEMYIELWGTKHDLSWSKPVYRGLQLVSGVGLVVALWVAL